MNWRQKISRREQHLKPNIKSCIVYAKRFEIVNGIVKVEGDTTDEELTNQEEVKDAGVMKRSS